MNFNQAIQAVKNGHIAELLDNEHTIIKTIKELNYTNYNRYYAHIIPFNSNKIICSKYDVAGVDIPEEYIGKEFDTFEYMWVKEANPNLGVTVYVGRLLDNGSIINYKPTSFELRSKNWIIKMNTKELLEAIEVLNRTITVLTVAGKEAEVTIVTDKLMELIKQLN